MNIFVKKSEGKDSTDFFIYKRNEWKKKKKKEKEKKKEGKIEARNNLMF